MGTIGNKRLMIKACELYFFQNKSQKEISALLGISRPQICRLITTAKEEGVVQISIIDPFVRETEMEKQLIQRFGVRDALVVDSSPVGGANRLQSFAKEAAKLVGDYIPQDSRVGVMSGYTSKAMIDAMEPSSKKLKLIVPLIGGVSTTNMSIHADTLAMHMAAVYGADAWNLNAPAVVSEVSLARSLKKEEAIARVLECGKRADIALVGIGNLDGTATNVRLGSLKKKDLVLLHRQGAVASVCGSYLDREGREVGGEITQRTIGLTLEELRKSKIIAAAIGIEKAEAIRAALRSKKVDILVTDMETARKIILEEEK